MNDELLNSTATCELQFRELPALDEFLFYVFVTLTMTRGFNFLSHR